LLDPRPGRTAYPSPSRLLSKAKLRSAWNLSRDSTKRAGRGGTDGITAQSFAAKLDDNLTKIARLLKTGEYGLSSLKPVFIPKPNSDLDRLICIPTVRDRLVQRTIVEYLVSKNKLPINNSSSFGFIRGRGTKEAISIAIGLRQKYLWCLKTDIESFFDRIPRQYLKKRVSDSLKVHSLTPILYRVIDCEVKESENDKHKFQKHKIKRGEGVRQGMPLSPILSNLVLSEFDFDIEKRKIKMVRYADDLILFFNSKAETIAGEKLVRELLQKIQLHIPQIDDQSKTQIIAPREPVDFLGREIVFMENSNSFVARVSKKQIMKIRARLAEEYSYTNQCKKNSTFQATIVELSKSVSAYLGIYKDASNFIHFESELRSEARGILSSILRDVFGETVLAAVTIQGQKFLGLGTLDLPEPVDELE